MENSENFRTLAISSMNTKQKIIIQSQAPTRIDLAGGTVDIWPLYLFLTQPVTLNLAINLYAEARLEIGPESNQPEICLRSEDQNSEITLSWADLLEEKKVPPQLELHFKLLRFFHQKRINSGWTDHSRKIILSTRAKSPAGAGLGGSSTLSIAMIGALATWANSQDSLTPIDPMRSGEEFIEIVRDVETTVIQVPAGLQDYYGAMYGGLQALRWGAGKHQRKGLSSEIIPELNQRILLFYSGQSRNSGINNWALFKGFIDRQDDIRNQFQAISNSADSLERALDKRDWVAAGTAIAEEWKIRKTLAPGISTPAIEQAFREANQIIPISGKVCGAGGGGCFFVYLADPSSIETGSPAKTKIQEVFTSHGMRPLLFEGAPHGLRVQVSHEGV